MGANFKVSGSSDIKSKEILAGSISITRVRSRISKGIPDLYLPNAFVRRVAQEKEPDRGRSLHPNVELILVLPVFVTAVAVVVSVPVRVTVAVLTDKTDAPNPLLLRSEMAIERRWYLPCFQREARPSGRQIRVKEFSGPLTSLKHAFVLTSWNLTTPDVEEQTLPTGKTLSRKTPQLMAHLTRLARPNDVQHRYGGRVNHLNN
ncbi:hypothetical protein FPANT_10377 [Fusarium pseudoanthophilum]|uniref:Uncharacterized protein n=1 Tax=Fusarium pseudoanthophilum TaxID=48495 RepID=A0A8H5KP94_9HYPO|nr:hypothetical protein FPANT_10377 [Fusarium pseudoanthophilum]